MRARARERARLCVVLASAPGARRSGSPAGIRLAAGHDAPHSGRGRGGDSDHATGATDGPILPATLKGSRWRVLVLGHFWRPFLRPARRPGPTGRDLPGRRVLGPGQVTAPAAAAALGRPRLPSWRRRLGRRGRTRIPVDSESELDSDSLGGPPARGPAYRDPSHWGSGLPGQPRAPALSGPSRAS